MTKAMIFAVLLAITFQFSLGQMASNQHDQTAPVAAGGSNSNLERLQMLKEQIEQSRAQVLRACTDSTRTEGFSSLKCILQLQSILRRLTSVSQRIAHMRKQKACESMLTHFAAHRMPLKKFMEMCTLNQNVL